MMRFIGLDCGPYRKPFEPLTAAQYKAFAKLLPRSTLKPISDMNAERRTQK